MRSMGVRYCIVVLCKMMWCENGELRIDVDERQAVEFCSCGGIGWFYSWWRNLYTVFT